MQYTTQIPVRSRESDILNKAADLLIACGFNLTSHDKNEVTLQGPGMRSTNQNPILGATEITLRQSHTMRGKVAVDADLGGVRWMRRFMIVLPLSLFIGISTLLVIVMAVVFAFVPKVNFPIESALILAVTGALMMFLFSIFTAIMTKRIRRNVETAIDACISNADNLLQREQ